MPAAAHDEVIGTSEDHPDLLGRQGADAFRVQVIGNAIVPAAHLPRLLVRFPQSIVNPGGGSGNTIWWDSHRQASMPEQEFLGVDQHPAQVFDGLAEVLGGVQVLDGGGELGRPWARGRGRPGRAPG